MEDINLEGTSKTPTVNFNSEKGELILKGRSIPENSVEFYQKLNQWIENYEKAPQKETTFNIMLEYFNTSSSKCILDLFKILERLDGNNTTVKVKWFYEEDDEDMAEAGEDYQAIISLPFEMKEVEEI